MARLGQTPAHETVAAAHIEDRPFRRETPNDLRQTAVPVPVPVGLGFKALILLVRQVGIRNAAD
jgi:hypothetical protein